MDTDGLALQSAHTWTFTTSAPVYPLVAVTAPSNGDNEVSRGTTVSATFSKEMLASSLNSPATTFQVFVDANSNGVYDAGTDSPVTGTVAYDTGGSVTATFTPTSPSPLAWGTKYTARISTAATDADGLPLLSDKVWTFTTTMPVYPTVTLTSSRERRQRGVAHHDGGGHLLQEHARLVAGQPRHDLPGVRRRQHQRRLRRRVTPS